jgi:hypothetical protein
MIQGNNINHCKVQEKEGLQKVKTDAESLGKAKDLSEEKSFTKKKIIKMIIKEEGKGKNRKECRRQEEKSVMKTTLKEDDRNEIEELHEGLRIKSMKEVEPRKDILKLSMGNESNEAGVEDILLDKKHPFPREEMRNEEEGDDLYIKSLSPPLTIGNRIDSRCQVNRDERCPPLTTCSQEDKLKESPSMTRVESAFLEEEVTMSSSPTSSYYTSMSSKSSFESSSYLILPQVSLSNAGEDTLSFRNAVKNEDAGESRETLSRDQSSLLTESQEQECIHGDLPPLEVRGDTGSLEEVREVTKEDQERKCLLLLESDESRDRKSKEQDQDYRIQENSVEYKKGKLEEKHHHLQQQDSMTGGNEGNDNISRSKRLENNAHSAKRERNQEEQKNHREERSFCIPAALPSLFKSNGHPPFKSLELPQNHESCCQTQGKKEQNGTKETLQVCSAAEQTQNNRQEVGKEDDFCFKKAKSDHDDCLTRCSCRETSTSAKSSSSVLETHSQSRHEAVESSSVKTSSPSCFSITSSPRPDRPLRRKQNKSSIEPKIEPSFEKEGQALPVLPESSFSSPGKESGMTSLPSTNSMITSYRGRSLLHAVSKGKTCRRESSFRLNSSTNQNNGVTHGGSSSSPLRITLDMEEDAQFKSKTVMSLSPRLEAVPPTPSPRVRRRLKQDEQQDVKSVPSKESSPMLSSQGRLTPTRAAPSRPAPSRPAPPVIPNKPPKDQLYPTTLNPFGEEDDHETTRRRSHKINDECKTKEDYPDDLNPFGDDDQDEDNITIKSGNGKKDNYDESLNPFGDEPEEDNYHLDESLASMSSLPSVTSSTTSSGAPTPRPRASVQSKQKQDIIDSRSRDEDIVRRSTQSTTSISSTSVRPKSLRNSFRPAVPPPPVPSNLNSPSSLLVNATSNATNPNMQHPFTNPSSLNKESIGSNPASSNSTPTPKKKSFAPLPPRFQNDLGNNNGLPLNNPDTDTRNHATESNPSMKEALKTILIVDKNQNDSNKPSHVSSSNSCNSSRRESDAGLGLDVSLTSESTNCGNLDENLDVPNDIHHHDPEEHTLEMSSLVTPSSASTLDHSEDTQSISTADGRPESSLDNNSLNSSGLLSTIVQRPPRKKRPAPAPPSAIRRTVVGSLDEIHEEISNIGDRLLEIQTQVSELESELVNNLTTVSVTAKSVDDGHVERQLRTHSPDEEEYRQQLIYQYLNLAKETCILARKQEELMYQKREHKLEEQHADLEYEIRAFELIPPFKRTPEDEDKIQQLINRLIEIIDQRNDVVENMTKINKR